MGSTQFPESRQLSQWSDCQQTHQSEFTRTFLICCFGTLGISKDPIFAKFQTQIWTACLTLKIVIRVRRMICIRLSVSFISRLEIPFYSPLLTRKPVPQSSEIGPSLSLQERIQNIQRDEAVLHSFTTVQNPSPQPLSVMFHSFINKSARNLWSSSSKRSVCLHSLSFLSLSHCSTSHHTRWHIGE